MISAKDLYWVAGILEGEGCFGFRGTPTIALSMTDLDVVDRAHKLLTPNTRLGFIEYRDPNHKKSYHFTLCGKRAASWMMVLYSLMGERRRSRIKECINKWKLTRIPDEDRKYCLHGHLLNGYNLDGKRYCRNCASKSAGKSRAKRKLIQREMVTI